MNDLMEHNQKIIEDAISDLVNSLIDLDESRSRMARAVANGQWRGVLAEADRMRNLLQAVVMNATFLEQADPK